MQMYIEMQTGMYSTSTEVLDCSLHTLRLLMDENPKNLMLSYMLTPGYLNLQVALPEISI